MVEMGNKDLFIEKLKTFLQQIERTSVKQELTCLMPVIRIFM